MLVVDITWWHPLLATVVGFIMGSLWFSPLMFGNQWIAIYKFKKSDMNQADINRAMFIQFIATLVSAIVLDVLVDSLAATTFWSGVLVGLLGWIGFAATTSLALVLYGKTPQKAYLLNASYFGVMYAVLGGLLAVL